MPTLFEQLNGKLAGNTVSVSITVQGDSLVGAVKLIEGLVSNPPESFGDLQQVMKELPLPPLDVGGDLASVLDSLKLALPSDLSSLTGVLATGLVELKTSVDEDITAVLKNAVDAAIAIYRLTQTDFSCEDAAGGSGATSGGATSGGAAGAGAAGGASGGATSAAAERAAAIDQVNTVFNLLPTEVNVESILAWLLQMTDIPRDTPPLTYTIPVLDDLRDPLETLLAWKSMTPAQIAIHIGESLKATEVFVQSKSDAVLNPLNASLSSLSGKLHSEDLIQIADGLTTHLTTLRAAISSGDLGATDSTVQAVNDLLDQYNATRAALEAEVLAQLPGITSSLGTLPDDLEDEMSHLISVLQPRGALSGIEMFNAPLDLGESKKSLPEAEQGLGTIITWLEDLVSKIDLTAIKEPLKTVADQTKAAVDGLDNSLVTVTLEVQKLFAKVESVLGKVDTAAITAKVKTEIQQFQTDLSKQLAESFAPVRDSLHEVVSEIDEGVAKFDPKQIIDSLKDVINKLLEVFDSPDVKNPLKQIRDALDGVSKEIESLSFAPLTDQVIKAIDEVTEILKGIDTSKLSAPVQMGLQAALLILPEDLTGVIDPIVSEFNELIDKGPVPLIETVEVKSKDVFASVRQFEPANFIGPALSDPYNNLLGKMDKFKPSSLLAPVQGELDKFKDRLKQEANPGQAIKPLEAPFDGLLKAFDSLKPEELVAPLEKAIKEVTDAIINAIPVEEALNQIDAALQSVADVVTIADHLTAVLQKSHDALDGLADGKTQLDALAESILDKVEAISDTAPIQQRFSAVSASLDGTRAAALSARFNSSVSPVLTALNQLDAQTRLMALVQAYRGCTQLLGPLPASAKKDAIANALGRFDPIQPSFNSPYQAMEDWKADITGAKADLDIALVDWDARFHSPDGVTGCFNHDQVTSIQLRQWVEEAIAPQFTEPFAALFIGAEFLRDNVGVYLAMLKRLATSLQAKLVGLAQGPGSLAEITDSLKALVQRLKDFNLGFLRDSLKDLFAKVRAKFDAVSPASLRKVIEEEFNKLVDGIDLGQLISPADVKKLDDDYAKIIGKLKALDPNKIIVEVVQPEFDAKIKPLLDTFDVTVVLTTLIKKLHDLSGELRAELDKVNEAYKALRKAVPSMSLSLDIDIDIDIGVSF